MSMMRRWMASVLLVCLLPCCAAAEYWTHDGGHSVSCTEGRPGCRILQMIMMGCFDYVETPDSLDERVLSAVLPLLRAITEEDIAHFCDSFSVEDAMIRAHYHKALANCLLADIHINPDPGGDETLIRRVLRLFLEPEAEENAQEQMDSIRAEMTEAVMKHMAQEMGVPESFISVLISGEQEATPGEAQR